MKKVIILCFALLGLTTTSLSAQSDTIAPLKNPAKLSRGFIGAGISYPLGLTVAGGARKGWGLSLSFNLKEANAKNLPNDYRSSSSFLSGDGTAGIEDDFFYAFSLRLSKQFGTSSKRFHWGIEAGPSFARSVIADKFVPVPNPCTYNTVFGDICVPNYTYERINHKSTGLSLKAKIGTEIFEDVLFELGGFYNRNAEWTFFGVDIVGSLGILKK